MPNLGSELVKYLFRDTSNTGDSSTLTSAANLKALGIDPKLIGIGSDGTNTNSDGNNNNNNNSSRSGGTSWWGGTSGGYSYGNSADNEQQAKNYTAISDFARQATQESYENQLAAIDANIKGNEALADSDIDDITRTGNNDWFKRTQQEQSTAMSALNNARMYGSIIPEFISGMSRVDDQSDTDILGDMQRQWNEVEKQRYQAEMDDINRKTTALADFIRDMKANIVDYYTTMSNLNPAYLNENQYWIDLLGGEKDDEESLKAIMDNSLRLPQHLQDMIAEFAPFEYPELVQYDYLRPEQAAFKTNSQSDRGSQNTSSSGNSEYLRAIGSEYANRKVE